MSQIESQIQSSNTEKDIKEETLDAIETANSILQNLKKKNPEKYKTAKKEYDELNTSISELVRSENKITKEELLKIRKEFEDIKKQDERDFIDKSKDALLNSIASGLLSLNESVSNETISSMLDKLDYFVSNENSNFLKEIKDELKGQTGKISALTMLKITQLIGKIGIMNSFHNKTQEKYIMQIVGSNKGFGNGYVQGFSNEKGGNYVMKITDFEKKLNNDNIKNTNSLALANYIKFIDANGGANPTTLFKRFGEKKLIELGELWKGNTNQDDPNSQIAKKELEKAGMKNIIKTITLFSSTENFLSDVPKLQGDDLDLAITYYKKNEKEIRDKFENYIKKTIESDYKGKSKGEMEEIFKLVMKDLDSIKNKYDLTEIAKKIKEIKEKYKLNSLSDKSTHGQIIRGAEVGAKIVFLETQSKEQILKTQFEDAKKRGNTEEMSSIQKQRQELGRKQLLIQNELIQYRKSSEVLGKLDNTVLSQLGTGEKNIDDVISEIRKTDKSFDETLKKYEKLEKEIQKSSGIKDKEEIKIVEAKSQIETLTYSTGTTIEYTQTNNGYALKTETGDIQITPEEFKIIEGNETAKENLVNFKNTLDELNLSGLWNYRNALLKGIGNVYGLDFDRKNYISENSLKLFLVSIAGSIGIPISTSENIATVKKNLKLENFVGVIGGTKDVNALGNSTIENMFIQKFDTKRSGVIEQGKFEQALKTKA